MSLDAALPGAIPGAFHGDPFFEREHGGRRDLNTSSINAAFRASFNLTEERQAQEEQAVLEHRKQQERLIHEEVSPSEAHEGEEDSVQPAPGIDQQQRNHGWGSPDQEKDAVPHHAVHVKGDVSMVPGSGSGKHGPGHDRGYHGHQGLPRPRSVLKLNRKDDVPDYSQLGKMRKSASRGDRLGPAAREALVTEVMETSDMDNLRLMQKLKERLDAAGMQLPQVEVRFHNITASAVVYVGKRAMPTLPNAARAMVESLASPLLRLLRLQRADEDRRTLTMLKGVSGVLKPGRLTLLLGLPGSGKSTLLKVLSGQMKDKAIKVSGEVGYNGVPLKDFVVERTAAYIDQVDRHIAEMTVRETMAFSARMMGMGFSGSALYPLLLKREQELGITPDPKLDDLIDHLLNNPNGANIGVDMNARLLGLDRCLDTVVGNDLLKGISGGQKKRVTTAEMVVGRMPCLFMDEISTGLDSASTFLITKALKNLCSFMKTNILVALLQPAPETVDIFDDIILMGQGHVLYHGPRSEVLAFFEGLGFSKPDDIALADFLQEVTSRVDQARYVVSPSLKARGFLPPEEVAKAFQASTQGVAMAEAMARQPCPSEVDMTCMAVDRYALGTWAMTWAVLKREVLLLKRNMAFIIARAIQTLLTAFMLSTTFVRQPKDNIMDANAFMSVAFFSLTFMMFSGFAEVPYFVQRLPVFYKQRNFNFYPAWSFCLAGALTRIPDNLLTATLWTMIIYWVVGFTPQPGPFFIFFLLMLSMSMWSTAAFRTLAAATRNETTAQSISSVFVLLTVNTCGFTITMGNIPKWWIYLFWANPLSYAVRGLLANEALNGYDWTQVQDDGQTLGHAMLANRDFATERWWIWLGVGVLLGTALLFTAMQAVMLTYLDAPSEGAAAVDEEDTDQAAAAKHTVVEMAAAPSAGAAAGAGAAPSKTSLSFTPFTLAFRGIKYHVPKPGSKTSGEELTLLQGVDGIFRPGVLTALMGASGAGKTTLMDVLAGRKTGGRTEGEMLLNGHPKVQATFARVMGYVEQFDVHAPQATVHESLLFSARMRLPQETGEETTHKFVDEVMALVELTPLAQGLVGLPGQSGLSVEQRKRLTIAVELVANPSVVFMDEPTSGLDARAAAIVMRAVRNTVNMGRTVVCTIHQPNLEIFQSFDELLLLKVGGQTIFFGPMGPGQANLINHFQSVEGVARFTPGNNPANWMLEVTAPGAEKKLGVDFADVYSSSPLACDCSAALTEASHPPEGSQPLHFDTEYSVPVWQQFRLLIQRNWTTYWRYPGYNLLRILMTIVCGLYFGSLYYDIGTDRTSMVGLLNIMGALYSTTVFMGVSNCVTVVAVVDQARVVFYRERAAGIYSPMPYAMAQALVELPYILLQCIMYAPVVYFLVGFEMDAVKFWWFFLFMLLLFTTFTLFGIAVINITPGAQLAMVVMAFLLTAWNLFCGFLQQQPSIPGWWIWMYWSSPLSYVLYGLCVSQLGDIHDEYIDMAEGSGGEPDMVPVSQYLEDVFGYKHSMLGYLVLIMLAYILFFRFLAVWALARINWQKR